MLSDELPSPAYSSSISYVSVFDTDSDSDSYPSISSSPISFRRRSITPSSSLSSRGPKVVSLLSIALRREWEEIAAAKRNARHYQYYSDDQLSPAQSTRESFSSCESSVPSNNDESTDSRLELNANQAANKKTTITFETPTPRKNRFRRSTKRHIPTPIPRSPALTPIQHSEPIPVPFTRDEEEELKTYLNFNMPLRTGWANEISQLARAGPLGLPGFDATTYLERDRDWVCGGCSTANSGAIFSCWACKGSKGAWCEPVIPEVDGPVGFLNGALWWWGRHCLV
jgi:hypothetical protein